MTARVPSVAASAAALGAAVLPKCPLCLLALGSAVGISFTGPSLRALSVAFAALSFAIIGRQAIANKRYGALVLAALAAALLVFARLRDAPPLVMFVAAALLAGGAIVAGRMRPARDFLYHCRHDCRPSK
ncbi:MAG: hypothetical protein JOZ54_14375 [Acidobacteria bacterium]|nr:hypothetical protein [Acidobacteriota bacterium]